MLRPACVGGDIGKVDLGLLAGGQLDLGLLRRLLQPLQGKGIAVKVDPGRFPELVRQVVHDPEVEVLAPEERVAVGREHLELVLTFHLRDLDDRDVEGTAAEIVYRDADIAPLLVHPVGQRRGGRLVDDAPHVEPRDPAGVLRCLALGIIEVRRDGDDRLADLLPEVVLRRLLHLHEHASGDLGRGHLASVGLHPGVVVAVGLHDPVGDHLDVALHHVVGDPAANQPLDREQGVVGVRHRLAFRRLADQCVRIGSERDDGRRGPIALAVLDDARAGALHDRDARVRGAEVDADGLGHFRLLRECDEWS